MKKHFYILFFILLNISLGLHSNTPNVEYSPYYFNVNPVHAYEMHKMTNILRKQINLPPLNYTSNVPSEAHASLIIKKITRFAINTAITTLGLSSVLYSGVNSNKSSVRFFATEIIANMLGPIAFSGLGGIVLPDLLQKWYTLLRHRYPFFKTHRGRLVFKAIAQTIEAALPLAIVMLQINKAAQQIR